MTKNLSNRTKAISLTLTCILLWAFIPVVSKIWQNALDNYQFLFYSSIFSLIVVFVSSLIVWRSWEFNKYKLNDFYKIAWLSFLWTFFYYLLLYYWYAHAKWLEVLVLQYTWAIFIVLFSLIFLKENIKLKTTISLLLWFIWVIIVLTKWNLNEIHLDNLLIDFIVLLWASSFALFSVLSKKVNYEPFSVTTYFFLFASVFSFVSMIMFSNPIIPWKESMITILINWAFINWLSYVLWLKALSYEKANFIAPFTFLTPVIATLLIVVIFKEEFLAIYLFWLIFVIWAGLINSVNFKKLWKKNYR